MPDDPIETLIKALGGSREVMRLCGVGRSAISNWRKRGAIPPRLFLCLARAGVARGVAVDPVLFREVTTKQLEVAE